MDSFKVKKQLVLCICVFVCWHSLAETATRCAMLSGIIGARRQLHATETR